MFELLLQCPSDPLLPRIQNGTIKHFVAVHMPREFVPKAAAVSRRPHQSSRFRSGLSTMVVSALWYGFDQWLDSNGNDKRSIRKLLLGGPVSYRDGHGTRRSSYVSGNTSTTRSETT